MESPALPQVSWSYAGGGNDRFCGNYLNRECVFYDFNGAEPPNQVGRNGDIVPLRINPASGEIKTLYQWETSENPSVDDVVMSRAMMS